MKVLLPLALVFAVAGSAEAQTQTQTQAQPASTVDVQSVDVRPVQVTGPVNIQSPALDLKTVVPERNSSEAASAGMLAEVVNAAGAGDAALQDPTTRSWWYLVGAIVAGGIILAVLL